MQALSHPQNLQRLPMVNPCHAGLINNFEDYATQNLIAIAQSTESQKVNPEKERVQQNASDISRWNHNYLNLLKYDTIRKKPEAKARVLRERNVPSENSKVSSQYLLNYPFKKKISRLRVPLIEKTLNSQELMCFSLQKNRSKTRNDIKLEIISSKHEITSNYLKNRTKTDPNCQNILKTKKDFNQYQKIRRKHCTLDHIQEKEKTNDSDSSSQSKLKYFFLSQLESPKINHLKGSAIHQLIPK